MAAAAREFAPRPAVTRLAWGLCLLAVLLAVAALCLAAFNGLNLHELVANHHAIGIMDALVLAPNSLTPQDHRARYGTSKTTTRSVGASRACGRGLVGEQAAATCAGGQLRAPTGP